MPDRCDVSVVIATYNEGPYLPHSVGVIRDVLEQTRHSYELIVVDDASDDGTDDVVRQLARDHGDVLRAVYHDGNQGRGATVSDGLRLARGEVAGFLDIDLEVDAHYIPAMVRALHGGFDVATAQRVYRPDLRHLHRHVLSVGYRWLSQAVLRHDLRDTETGYKFFRRQAVLPLLDRCQDRGWFWDTEIMLLALRSGLRIAEIPCVFTYRYEKSSTVRLTHDVAGYLGNLWRARQRLRRAISPAVPADDVPTPRPEAAPPS